LVDEGKGNAFNATGNSMIAEPVGLEMASNFPMFGRNSLGHLKAMYGYNIRKCVEMLIMIMLQCGAFLEV
jgi:hypothetical protein